ncbi:MAG: IS1 family transposase [Verrucomicrobia bacterium]|nr:IS1 family transposase [Verrucomicrobiota bacterium]
MDCPRCNRSGSVVKKGFFPQSKIPGGKSQRFRCRACRLWFSQTRGTLNERQKRPELHQPIFSLLVSGVSQRRAARLCGTTQVTVARKLVRLSHFANIVQDQRLAARKGSVSVAVFDEMETFEHTKCKPVAIAVAVEEKTRLILSAKVASMPAKGHLAKISRRRYGKRKDDRKLALGLALTHIAQVAAQDLTVKSDQCPRYPALVSAYLPGAEHKTFKGRRGCIVGQGELKAGGWDPLFALNHTCAMIRDNIKCLSRRTWCTTKRVDRLQCRLDLYVCAHNALIELKLHGKHRRRRGIPDGAGGAQGGWPLQHLALAA